MEKRAAKLEHHMFLKGFLIIVFLASFLQRKRGSSLNFGQQAGLGCFDLYHHLLTSTEKAYMCKLLPSISSMPNVVK